MKLRAALAASLVLVAVPVFAGEKQELKTESDSLSYALGADMGSKMKQNAVDLDMDLFEKGLKDALSGNKTLMSDDEIKAIISNVKKEIQEKQRALKKIPGEKNRREGGAFLAENRKKEGVKTLPDGLQYRVIKEGRPSSAGAKPIDTVVVNLRGTLIDGTEFINSGKSGKPMNMMVESAVKGLAEALRLMNVGSKWQVFLPSELAYGDKGTPDGAVGPGATVIYEVELLLVKRGQKKLAD